MNNDLVKKLFVDGIKRVLLVNNTFEKSIQKKDSVVANLYVADIHKIAYTAGNDLVIVADVKEKSLVVTNYDNDSDVIFNKDYSKIISITDNMEVDTL